MSAGLPAMNGTARQCPIGGELPDVPVPEVGDVCRSPDEGQSVELPETGEPTTSLKAPALFTRPTWAPPTADSLKVTNQISPLGRVQRNTVWQTVETLG